MCAILAPQTKEPAPASTRLAARDLCTLGREQRQDDLGEKSPLPMETEGQSRQRVGGGRSFWLLCVVVVLCVVARVGRIFVRESKMVQQNLILFYPWCYYATQKYHDMRRDMPYVHTRVVSSSLGNVKIYSYELHFQL